MKHHYFYAPILSLGLLVFTASSHAQLDCNKFVYSQITFQACNTLNQTTAAAKKEDEARFAKVQAQQQMLLKNTTQQPAQTQQPINNPSTQPKNQLEPTMNAETTPTAKDTPSEPITPPNDEPASPETVPGTQNATPNHEQKSSRIKYY